MRNLLILFLANEELSNGVDNPDDLSEFIVRIVSESVDEFAPMSQRKTKKKRLVRLNRLDGN